MAKDIAIIQVCFNTLDPYQKRQYEHASSFPNKSGYLKRLVQSDMERSHSPIKITKQIEPQKHEDDFNPDGFI